MSGYSLTHLKQLEAESIHIIREVVAEFENPVMLYSIGKDSACMVHLALKAFHPAKPPFPLMHVDTTWKFREMYALRDNYVAKELGLKLIVHVNQEGLKQGINPITHGSKVHTDVMKTEGLKQALNKYQFDAAFGHPDLLFKPPAELRPRIAPTTDDRHWRKRLLVGEVEDENAWALGGVAGHAGVFGTAPAVGAYARLVLRTLTEETSLGEPWLLRRFLMPSRVTRSSRALGWDLMRPTSSCGHRLSASAFGHTGFTGVSLWIDPQKDVYVVLLANRVHPERPVDPNDGLAKLRPLVHDAVMDALER